jgi:hypothetical protein
MGGWNAYFVTNSCKPHGQKMDTTSSSVVPRFAMRVIERSLSIYAELRIVGFVVAVTEKWLVILFYTIDSFSSALPNKTENALHHITTVLYFARSVPSGIS